jgi:hypothetical protein
VIFALLLLLGISYIDLPGIGTLGLIDGWLHIPFIGSFELEIRDLRAAYLMNFFLMGSWNLLWPVVVFGLLLAARGISGPWTDETMRAAFGFMVIFFATQVFIFCFTDRGEYAELFTAINRLPLHFLPALLYATATVIWSRLSLARGQNIRQVCP